MAEAGTMSEHLGATVQVGCNHDRHPHRRRGTARVTGGVAEVLRLVPPAPRAPSPIDQLTAKEREVLAMVAEGASNDGIAARLGVTARTVETHTGRIFAKLGILADPANHRRVLAALIHLRATTTFAD